MSKCRRGSGVVLTVLGRCVGCCKAAISRGNARVGVMLQQHLYRTRMVVLRGKVHPSSSIVGPCVVWVCVVLQQQF